MVNYMRQGGGTLYDGVSASGDATNRLIANGDVASIDISRFPEYAKVMQSLQAPAHNTVDGVHYGVPYMWGPNFLMYNTAVVNPAPTSWACDVRCELSVCRQDHRLRQPDLHRRRGAVPEDAPTAASASPITYELTSSSARCSYQPVEAAGGDDQEVLGVLPR